MRMSELEASKVQNPAKWEKLAASLARYYTIFFEDYFYYIDGVAWELTSKFAVALAKSGVAPNAPFTGIEPAVKIPTFQNVVRPLISWSILIRAQFP